jgi:hypothetical protein
MTTCGSQAGGGNRTATFWLTAFGCNSLPLANEPVVVYPTWINIELISDAGNGHFYYGTPITNGIPQYLTTDNSGYVQWASTWPYLVLSDGSKLLSTNVDIWTNPGTETILTGYDNVSYVYIKKDGSGYSLASSSDRSDPSIDIYSAEIGYMMYTQDRSKYIGYGRNAYRSTYGGDEPMLPGQNSWSFTSQWTHGYLCWTGRSRPVSSRTVNVTGGGGVYFPDHYITSDPLYVNWNNALSTKSGPTWKYVGTNSWTPIYNGTYKIWWSLNSPYSSKTLTAWTYTYSYAGGTAPVDVSSPNYPSIGYDIATATVSPSSSTTSGTFSATYNFSGTPFGNATGISTVTLTEP